MLPVFVTLPSLLANYCGLTISCLFLEISTISFQLLGGAIPLWGSQDIHSNCFNFEILASKIKYQRVWNEPVELYNIKEYRHKIIQMQDLEQKNNFWRSSSINGGRGIFQIKTLHQDSTIKECNCFLLSFDLFQKNN